MTSGGPDSLFLPILDGENLPVVTCSGKSTFLVRSHVAGVRELVWVVPVRIVVHIAGGEESVGSLLFGSRGCSGRIWIAGERPLLVVPGARGHLGGNDSKACLRGISMDIGVLRLAHVVLRVFRTCLEDALGRSSGKLLPTS